MSWLFAKSETARARGRTTDGHRSGLKNYGIAIAGTDHSPEIGRLTSIAKKLRSRKFILISYLLGKSSNYPSRHTSMDGVGMSRHVSEINQINSCNAVIRLEQILANFDSPQRDAIQSALLGRRTYIELAEMYDVDIETMKHWVRLGIAEAINRLGPIEIPERRTAAHPG